MEEFVDVHFLGGKRTRGSLERLGAEMEVTQTGEEDFLLVK
jgi:hypothetical protein